MSGTKLSNQDHAFFPYIYTENVYILKDEQSNLKETVAKSPLPEQAPKDLPVQKAAPVESITKKNPEIDFFGKNLKKTIIVLPEDKSKFTPEIKAFLFKILASVQHTEDDVALCFASAEIKLKDINSSIPFNYLISFGVGHIMTFSEKYKTVKADNKSFVLADDLTVIFNDATKKRPLWESLKDLFGI
jgi:hypothetical protein